MSDERSALLPGHPGPGPDSASPPRTRETRARHDSDQPLPIKERLGYGLGHILNDLCASMWFTYLLLYFHKVLNFENIYAGVVLCVGQIADGISTPFVGYFSDKGADLWLCNKYGKRKSWHLIGTICVIISFPFIFTPVIDNAFKDEWAQLISYCVFVVIFQFGWASNQISHLSMIPDITPSANERTGLTAIRYAATVASNITVFLLTWLFLGLGHGNGMVGPEDAGAFRNIMLVSVSLGIVASVLFHLTVNPANPDDSHLDEDQDRVGEEPGRRGIRRMNVIDWFYEPQFYLVAGVYMTTRLVVNLSQAYIPLYLQVSLQLNASYVAIIPLVMFIFGLITSTLMKSLNRRIGRIFSFIIGCVLVGAAVTWIKLGCPICGSYTHYEIFGVAALLGSGCSTMLITSLSLTADLIGRNVESGAFVYGAMSLSDKLSNGVAVILIQSFIPGNTDTCITCRYYFRDIIFYVCGGCALLGAIFMISLKTLPFGERWRDRRHRDYEQVPGQDHPDRDAESEPHPTTIND